MFTDTGVIVSSLLVGLVIVSRFVWVPWRKAQSKRKVLALVDKHCSLELVEALSFWPKEDGKLNLPEEARTVLNKLYGFTVVNEAIRAVNTGKTEILIPGQSGWPRTRQRQMLETSFDKEGEITKVRFYPVYGSGKTGP